MGIFRVKVRRKVCRDVCLNVSCCGARQCVWSDHTSIFTNQRLRRHYSNCYSYSLMTHVMFHFVDLELSCKMVPLVLSLHPYSIVYVLGIFFYISSYLPCFPKHLVHKVSSISYKWILRENIVSIKYILDIKSGFCPKNPVHKVSSRSWSRFCVKTSCSLSWSWSNLLVLKVDSAWKLLVYKVSFWH